MRTSYLRAGLLTASLLLGAAQAQAIDLLSGQWTLNPADKGKVQLTLVRSARPGNMFTHGSDWNAADLKGLDLATQGRHDVRFTVARDAGTLEAEGFVSGSEGAGLFKFAPNPKYAADMAALGFPGVEQDRQLSMALSDVSLAFAKEMSALKIDGLDLRRLRSFRTHKIDAAFVKAIRAENLSAVTAKELVNFAVHEVTPEFIKAVRAEGLTGIGPKDLVNFRIHEVTLGYIKAVRAQGFTPTEKQLIALKIHDVTPEYIADLKKRGMEKLTLDKVVSLKIHGIS